MVKTSNLHVVDRAASLPVGCEEHMQKLDAAVSELEFILDTFKEQENSLNAARRESVDQELLLANRVVCPIDPEDRGKAVPKEVTDVVKRAISLRVELHEIAAGLTYDLEDDMSKVEVTEKSLLGESE